MTLRRPIFVSVVMLSLIGAILFGGAGSVQMPWLWAYLALLAGAMTIARRVMDPGLVQERLRPGPGGVDRVMQWWFLPFFVGHLLIAGLDAGRFHWTGPVPIWVRCVGASGLLAALVASMWTLRTNRFFSPVVRIQHDRGHQVISSGPYAWIRHPGYAASMIGFPFGPLMMGSYWSALPLLGAMALLARRTIIEDRYLHENLEGYRDYAARVRFRLIPGIW